MNHPIYNMFPQYSFQFLTYKYFDGDEVAYWILFYDPYISFKVMPFDNGYLVVEILQQQSLPEVRVENYLQLKLLIEERMEEYLEEMFRNE